MKKIITLALATVMMFGLSACAGGGSAQSEGNAAQTSGNTSPPSAKPDPADVPSPDAGTSADNSGTKVLVAYFSLPETNDADNMTEEEDNSVVVIDGEVLGNTQYVA